MVAAFQLNLFNTSAIEGEIARIERIRSEKDVIKALIGKAHSTLTNLETLLTGIQNVTLRETLQSAIAQELSKLFPSEGAAVATVSCDDPEKSLAVRAAAKLVPYFLNRQAITNKILSRVMAEVAGSTDAEGAWIWKDVYDAIETALVMFIQQEGNSLISQEGALNRPPAKVLFSYLMIA